MSRPGRWWPWAIGTVLGITIAGNLWVMRLAGSDDSFAIEPDYYAKAIAWDSTMAQASTNAGLGWRLEVATMRRDSTGGLELTTTLRDAGGAPITDAALQVAATHNAHGNRVLTEALHPTGDGSYATELAGGQAGIWELRFVATRGAERFTRTLHFDTTTGMAVP